MPLSAPSVLLLGLSQSEVPGEPPLHQLCVGVLMMQVELEFS